GSILQVSAGQPFSGLAATFTSGDSAATAASFTASINWGDGTTSTGTITANARRGFDVNGAHTYAKAGDFAVSVSVNEKSANAKGAQVTFAFVAPAPHTPIAGQHPSSGEVVRSVGTVTPSSREITLNHAATSPLRVTAFSPAFAFGGTSTRTVLAATGESAATQVVSFTAAPTSQPEQHPMAAPSDTVAAESKARILPSR